MIRMTSLLVFLSLPGLATANLKDCTPLVPGTSEFKVLVDELVLPAQDNVTALAELKTSITFSLTSQLEEFQAEVLSQNVSPTIALQLVPCPDRKPSLTGSEFDADRVMALSDERVVVELWGNLMAPAGTQTAPRATLGYVIPPVRHYLPGPKIQGLFLINYPREGVAQPGELHKLPEASAFALFGLAVKARNALNYDLATWAFGRSAGSMKLAQQSGGTGNLQPLLDYIEVAMCETREAARADSRYRGALTLTPRKLCGGAT